MQTIEINVLYQNMVEAARDARVHLRNCPNTPSMLDRLWYLQDNLHRLVEAAHDCPRETFGLMGTQHKELILQVIEVLSVAVN